MSWRRLMAGSGSAVRLERGERRGQYSTTTWSEERTNVKTSKVPLRCQVPGIRATYREGKSGTWHHHALSLSRALSLLFLLFLLLGLFTRLTRHPSERHCAHQPHGFLGRPWSRLFPTNNSALGSQFTVSLCYPPQRLWPTSAGRNACNVCVTTMPTPELLHYID